METRSSDADGSVKSWDKFLKRRETLLDNCKKQRDTAGKDVDYAGLTKDTEYDTSG